jgi:predicted TIM-barrel fold metal-dependent hydrolase
VCSLRILSSRGLVFDLQANPHQLARAADIFKHQVPDLQVVVNHMGCPHVGSGPLTDEPAASELTTWRNGMAALATNPNVFVKISMLTFIRKVCIV